MKDSRYFFSRVPAGLVKSLIQAKPLDPFTFNVDAVETRYKIRGIGRTAELLPSACLDTQRIA